MCKNSIRYKFSAKIIKLAYNNSGAPRGNTKNVPPPEIEKCCRKMMLFPKALFLATAFPKIDKNQIFLKNFYRGISKFSQNFPTICIFRPNARRINAGL